MEVLDINPDWRMHTVSDGQRRRVQICLGLLKPFDVLLLDEITVDLDVLGRADLMEFLKEECEQREATIIYVRHCPCKSIQLPVRAILELCIVRSFAFADSIVPMFCWLSLKLQGSAMNRKSGQDCVSSH